MGTPTSVPVFLTLQDGIDFIIAAHPNDRAAEITAMAAFLGVATGRSQAYSDSVTNMLKNYQQGCKVDYKSTTELYVRTGCIYIPDAEGNFSLRVNAEDLTVGWGDLDTGAEANSTQYYVYAVADASGTSFAIVISESDSAPTGYDYYRKIGSFYNDGSGNIVDVCSYNTMTGRRTYDSGWYQQNHNTSVTKYHNLGTVAFIFKIYLADDTDGTYMRPVCSWSASNYACELEGITATTFDVQTGNGGIGILDNNGTMSHYTTGKYLRVIAATIE